MRISIFSLILLALSGCGGGSVSAPPVSNSLLIVGYDREPDTLNRFATHILEDTMICINDGLVVYNERMEVVPVLAEIVPTRENGLVEVQRDGTMTVTWKLKSDIRWHDGTPLTSADISFTVEAINDPSYNPESTEGFDRIEPVPKTRQQLRML